MRKIFKLSTLFILAISLVSCGSNQDTGSNNSDGYTIKWTDYDGTVLKVDSNVAEGTVPSYTGGIPNRPSTNQYYYVFEKWSPDITPATSDKTYVAVYDEILTCGKIIYDLNGGESESYVPYRLVYKVTSYDFFYDVHKEGSNFRGWSYNGVLVIDKEGNMLAEIELAETMKFTAVFSDKSQISVKQNYDDACEISGLEEYTPGSYAHLSIEVNPGYIFDGWYKDGNLISTDTEITYLVGSSDETLEVKFEYDTFTLTVESYNFSYGAVNIAYSDNTFAERNIVDYKYKDYVVVDCYNKTSHKFIGWYTEDGELVNENARFSFHMPNHDYKLIAKWDYFKLTLTNTMPVAGKLNGGGYRICDTTVTIRVDLNPGYIFSGWFNVDDTLFSDELEVSFIMPRKPLELIAKFTVGTSKLTVLSENEEKGTVEGGGNYLTGETVTIKAFPNLLEFSKKKYVFVGWFKGDELVSTEEIYTFFMPGGDTTYVAKFELVNKSDNDMISFGRYPQSRVVDSETLNILANYDQYLKEEKEPFLRQPFVWFYAQSNEITFAWYLDLDLDLDGLNDYRGIYYIHYRNEKDRFVTDEEETTVQYKNGYFKCTVYWFKYEPIEWRILKGEENDLFIFSEKLIDAERFAHQEYVGDIMHPDFSKYIPNNYQTSYIRRYLNNNVFNTAFNAEEKKQIKTTVVDNSAASSGYRENPFACENTNDKLFFLSRTEACDKQYGFESVGVEDPNRMKQKTDYATAIGFPLSQYDTDISWWLRSPTTEGPITVHAVRVNGTYDSYIPPSQETIYVCHQHPSATAGVVPAAHISL